MKYKRECSKKKCNKMDSVWQRGRDRCLVIYGEFLNNLYFECDSAFKCVTFGMTDPHHRDMGRLYLEFPSHR